MGELEVWREVRGGRLGGGHRFISLLAPNSDLIRAHVCVCVVVCAYLCVFARLNNSSLGVKIPCDQVCPSVG